ncbi:LysR substrate-binding domain-containing protein [Phyllobacterium myrsinacearum]|uniref:Putative choline sulfate-utilization transcription factor n=1 Tax=Phyllobacterium myrsinacearum TaxID=28101 RepID=A0A839EY83_9HYPH|nr:LysR substrate-binding domain-containing protein [Phyllobacterium myrsinacearum]MBA8881450.1 putative choline sulfate-utilization transcription factor [Phyllobacterium myrsinacearum]
MTGMFYNLGSIRVLETVGRLKNLTRAATELGMTQPAISYQIRQMEESIGIPLFKRLSKGVAMTPEGQLLYDAACSAIIPIDVALNKLAHRKPVSTIHIFTDYGFATFQLMPRIANFRNQFPDLDVRIIASSERQSLPDTDIDVSVIFGSRDDVSHDAEQLFVEDVTPVCSPGFLEKNGPFFTLFELAAATLLHLDNPGNSRWFTWQNWFDTAGLDHPLKTIGLSMNTYSLVLDAAIAGQGIALGWKGLTDRAIALGTLTPAFDLSLKSRNGYWLSYSNGITDEKKALINRLVGL